ncbi:MAG: hypothetical protein QM747_08050 [Nocardioides sp.]
MRISTRHLVPVAVLAALAVSTLSLTDDGAADASDGTAHYGGGAGQPTYFFFDAHDTAGAANAAESDPGNQPEWNSSDVCDNNPQLEALMGTQDADSQLYTCALLINDCPVPASGQLLGLTVAPGNDPSTVTDNSTCWTYPDNVDVERTAPQVWLPSERTAQDPVFDVSDRGGAADPAWTLQIAAPNGPKTGTEIRASEATVDGSVPLHSLGETTNGGTETARASFAYVDWSQTKRWAEVTTDGRWIVISQADGLTLDPQVCLDSGMCQETKTLQYIGWDSGRDSATILPHM